MQLPANRGRWEELSDSVNQNYSIHIQGKYQTSLDIGDHEGCRFIMRYRVVASGQAREYLRSCINSSKFFLFIRNICSLYSSGSFNQYDLPIIPS